MPQAAILDTLPRWVVIITVALAVLLGIGLVWAVLIGAGPAPLATATAGQGDAAAYAEVVARIQGGEGYYPAAHAVLLAEGYGTTSVFNWRLPGWPYLLGWMPGGVMQALAGGLALAGVGFAFLVLRPIVGRVTAAVAALFAALSFGGLLAAESLYFTEVIAGVLIFASVIAYAGGQRALGVLAGLTALFLRELAAPYVVVAIIFALAERQWREVGAWAAGLAVFSVYFGLHAGLVAGQLGPMDTAYPEGWVQFGGLGFIATSAHFNGLFALLPEWTVALIVPLGLLGLAATPGMGRALATVLLYLAAFAVIGKPFNGYWGALYTPLLSLGVPLAVLAVRRFATA